jgi:hypothetical protein
MEAGVGQRLSPTPVAALMRQAHGAGIADIGELDRLLTAAPAMRSGSRAAAARLKLAANGPSDAVAA